MRLNDCSQLSAQTIVLERHRFVLAAELSRLGLGHLSDAISIRTIEDISGNLTIELCALIASNMDSLEKEAARFPKTWWDAFKLRWFPKWALKRWPAEWEVVRFRVEATQFFLDVPHVPGRSTVHLAIREVTDHA